jgi:hypothetical protein
MPLLFTPRLIVSLCASEPRKVTDFETYLCRTLGLTLLALAASNLIFSGVLPIGPAQVPSAPDPAEGGRDKSKDVAKATATVAVTFQALTAFYLYTQLASQPGFSFAFSAGLVGNAFLFCFGVWTLLFADESGRRSRSTGADKRTSNFPFENKESAREKKKESRKDEKEGKREKRSFLKSR